jgi:DNA replication protein DnaC
MSDTLVLERLQNNLSRLRLPRIGAMLPEMASVAQEQGKSYLSFLDELLEEEVGQKEQRRIETGSATGHHPF